MPSGSGYPHYRASRALYFAHGLTDCDVDIQVSVMSALAHNFNRLWSNALNEHYDFFAMLHDDVVPQDGWLRILHEILTFKKLDMVSCVIRIKNETGDTSTAVGWKHPDRGQSFDTPRRLTVNDAKALPETFTFDQIPASMKAHADQDCLLLNTGCWIARLRYEWARKCWFEQNDDIIRDGKKLLPVFEPEDWNFSRLANQHGARLAATRAVNVVHYGHKAW
jgi:hypothetical protein